MSACVQTLLRCVVVLLSAVVPHLMIKGVADGCVVLLSPLQSLIAPVGFGIGATYLAQYELQQVGVQFVNINTSPVSRAPHHTTPHHTTPLTAHTLLCTSLQVQRFLLTCSPFNDYVCRRSRC